MEGWRQLFAVKYYLVKVAWQEQQEEKITKTGDKFSVGHNFLVIFLLEHFSFCEI